MGVFKMFQDDSPAPDLGGGMFAKWRDKRDQEIVRAENSLPNPNPKKYKILRSERIGRNLVVEIKYIGCTNYEGKKILLFEHLTVYQLTANKFIDPHFSEKKFQYSPFARFEPTERGWSMACLLAKEI